MESYWREMCLFAFIFSVVGIVLLAVVLEHGKTSRLKAENDKSFDDTLSTAKRFNNALRLTVDNQDNLIIKPDSIHAEAKKEMIKNMYGYGVSTAHQEQWNCVLLQTPNGSVFKMSIDDNGHWVSEEVD